MSHRLQDDLDFTYKIAKNESVLISRDGRFVTILRGSRAVIFIEKIDVATFPEQQQLMARATGNYRRGNERSSKNHPRNR